MSVASEMSSILNGMEDSLIRRLLFSAVENNDTDILMVAKKSNKGARLLGKSNAAFYREEIQVRLCRNANQGMLAYLAKE